MPPPSNVVYWHNLTKWWDGYSGQDAVVFDEFYGQLPYQFMLRVLDRYPLQVETKGGMAELTATNFYFTSNLAYDDWWFKAVQDGSVNIAAFIRRVQEFGSVVTYTLD